MMLLSKKLALSLKEYQELDSSLKAELQYLKNNPDSFFRKGNVRLFQVEDQYLCIDTEHYDSSLLKDVYGDYIDRTNENSFDTELYFFFTYFKSYYRNLNVDNVMKFVEGMETYAQRHGFKSLWHLIIQSTMALRESYESSYSQLLLFFSIIETILLSKSRYDNNKKKYYVTDECASKLPFFLENNKIEKNNLTFMHSIDASLIKNKHSYKLIAQIRNKVIHGELEVANNLLETLFPESKSNTEDAESSSFQDQLRNLNMLVPGPYTTLV
ncbi:hypothetical protein [Sporosarcina ureae]|uniref:hypothetical protein n=1 Tax=Sporosarcina ureae TaxID=1571 RepID=UPI0026F30457|nr:hypothetical protein [Sporosarcina ureae]